MDDGIKVERKVELYEHQTVSLQEIQKRREAGIKAFLIVLPTAAGKSKIAEEDLRTFAEGKQKFRGLILVPGVNLLLDWEERIKASLPELKDKIDIRTYAFAARHYTDTTPDYYNYLVVDEAHHAVAPVLKRVVQYYRTEFTIGLTATDQRPDKRKLETVFGSYTTSLSLKEAMEKGVVAKANVYRIETNLDLSSVRFNGRDYVNADLEKRIRVTSRNELIVQVLSKYFTSGEAGTRQGVVFVSMLRMRTKWQSSLIRQIFQRPATQGRQKSKFCYESVQRKGNSFPVCLQYDFRGMGLSGTRHSGDGKAYAFQGSLSAACRKGTAENGHQEKCDCD